MSDYFLSSFCRSWTALMWACYKGHAEICEMLLKKEASPNVHDQNHITGLVWAAGRGFDAIVSLLIEFGAKVEAGDKVSKIDKRHYTLSQVKVTCITSLTLCSLYCYSN